MPPVIRLPGNSLSLHCGARSKALWDVWEHFPAGALRGTQKPTHRPGCRSARALSTTPGAEPHMRSQCLRRPLSPAPPGRRVSEKTPGVATLMRGLAPRMRNRVPPRSSHLYPWRHRGWAVCGAPGSRAPPGLSSTEVQGAAEGAGPGASGAPLPAAAAPQFALLVMRPCGGPGEPAALGGGAGAAGAPGCLCEGTAAGGEEAAEDEADLLDAADGPGGGESAASLEDPEDEGLLSGGEGGPGAARRRGGGGGCVSKTCTYEGCRETTSQVAKQRKPWMCKKHRNKMYKDKYKKKKSDQAQSCGGAAPAGGAGNVKLEESPDNILSIVKPRTGSFGDRPARPTLLEQVLNQKRLSLLRSPEVVQFLQKQQQLLNQQVLEQRQQQFPGTSV
ncbi:regulatory factor X-associated protein isoform X3 [Manis pentadactyla]|uniref:regulatory factor X-associated protein isoform X3 n=1 Tax=Manis pentadactyla TaxID=143292 RepID=UPI00255C43CA|nr:regulatory factor X-associated protein isoform X3 [Manis pentadactyla]